MTAPTETLPAWPYLLDRPRVRLTPRAVQTGIAVGAAGIVAAWWANTPRIVDLGEFLTNAGRLTGLLGGYAVLVVVLLVARIPAIDRGVGTDRLTRWHAFAGRYAMGLVVAHGLLILTGYAVTYDNSLLGQAEILLGSRSVLLAAVALGLFSLVGAVSARAARHRMRYEVWYYLHFVTYVAVFLSLPHEMDLGAELRGDEVAGVLWSNTYKVVGLLLIWYRVVRPVRLALRHRLRVTEVTPETPGVVSLTVSGRRLGDLGAEPGQFFRFRFLTRSGWWQSHPFSLSAPLQADRMRITVKACGDHTTELQCVRPGVRVLASGPYGGFTPALRSRAKVLLLAGGVGIAPLRAMFAALAAEPGDVTLIYRAERPEDFALRDELDAIAAERGATVHYLAGPPGEATDPLVADRLARLVPGLRAHDVFLCGPSGFTRAATAALETGGVHPAHIHSEQFTF